jgi:hypothetical protein
MGFNSFFVTGAIQSLATLKSLMQSLQVGPGACILKLITTVIYGFHNKLVFVLNTRLGWKGLPGTNTLAYYGNRKLRL